MKTKRESTAAPSEKQQTIETRKLADLKTHPRQDSLYHAMSELELDRLAKDIERNGIREMVEVTPDGRIISGHQRVRAARRLGWKEIDVCVRNDLADDRAIERRLIEANRIRRQLDPLDQIRLEVRMFEIGRKREPGQLSDFQRRELRDHLAEFMNMSGRHIKRFLNILEAPMEVQHAVTARKLKMTLAAKVGSLKQPVKEKIAAAIRAGGDPTTIVNSLLPKSQPKLADPGKVFDLLVDTIESAMESLAGREDEIRRHPDDLQHASTVLKRFSPFNRQLRLTLKATKADMEKGFEDLETMCSSPGGFATLNQ